MSPALLRATTAFSKIAYQPNLQYRSPSLSLSAVSAQKKRQVHSCTFKYGNAPLLSAVSIPMNNQAHLHRTAAPRTSTEGTKAQRSRRGKHTRVMTSPTSTSFSSLFHVLLMPQLLAFYRSMDDYVSLKKNGRCCSLFSSFLDLTVAHAHWFLLKM